MLIISLGAKELDTIYDAPEIHRTSRLARPSLRILIPLSKDICEISKEHEQAETEREIHG